MTCWPNQWQQIFLLGLCWAVSHPEGMEHNLPYSGGALCMLRGTPMEAESFVSLFKIFDLQSASAASARFFTLPLSEIVPSSEILIECHIDLEASFKALLTLIPVDHLEWDEPLKNISCSGERSRLFQWESHSLCLSLFFNSSMQF